MLFDKLRKHFFSPRTVLFYRQFGGFTGGHLKVWDYYQHVQHATGWRAAIYLTPDSDPTNPWRAEREQVLSAWQPAQADVLFLAGLDWLALPAAERDNFSRPVVNLIQHVRHANPADPRYAFLSHRAVRICVSAEVTAALQATGRVNGPLLTNPNGLDFNDLPAPSARRAHTLCIAGLKQPALAGEIHARLAESGINVKLLTTPLPRAEFLAQVNDAAITLFLPHETEGFYLPALEGMALETLVICPDCIGNRGFCLAEENCLQPVYTVEDVIAAVHRAVQMPAAARTRLLQNAKQTVAAYSLARERRTFLKILEVYV